MSRTRTWLALAALAFAGLAGAQPAAPGPARTIKVLIGFPAGGPPDTVLRQVAARRAFPGS